MTGDEHEARTVAAPTPKVTEAVSQTFGPKAGSNARVISEPQRKRFYAMWKGSGKEPEAVKTYLRELIGTDDSSQIPSDKYEAACAWAEAK